MTINTIFTPIIMTNTIIITIENIMSTAVKKKKKLNVLVIIMVRTLGMLRTTLMGAKTEMITGAFFRFFSRKFFEKKKITGYFPNCS